MIADKLLVRTQRIDHGRGRFTRAQHHGAAALPALQRGRCRNINGRINVGTQLCLRRLARCHGRTCAHQRCRQPTPFQRLAHHPHSQNKSAETYGHRRLSPTQSGKHLMSMYTRPLSDCRCSLIAFSGMLIPHRAPYVAFHGADPISSRRRWWALLASSAFCWCLACR